MSDDIAMLRSLVNAGDDACIGGSRMIPLHRETVGRILGQLETGRHDSERIDRLELIIRDGSYASILNDIIAFCQVAYKTFGSGPSLRTAIDATMPEQLDNYKPKPL